MKKSKYEILSLGHVDVGRPRRALAASQLCAIEDRGPSQPLPLKMLICASPTSKGPTSWHLKSIQPRATLCSKMTAVRKLEQKKKLMTS